MALRSIRKPFVMLWLYVMAGVLQILNCACGTHFSVEHVLSCPKGGYPSIRHNEIRDLTAALLSEVCHNVSAEPHLQPMTSEVMSGSTLSEYPEWCTIGCCSRWILGESVRTGVKVFNPYAPQNEKRGNMTNVSVKSNTALLLHLFSLALVALGLKPQQALC